MALWMPVLGAVQRNPALRTVYERLSANGQLPRIAPIAAMRKLLHAIDSVAKHLRPFVLPSQHRADLDAAASCILRLIRVSVSHAGSFRGRSCSASVANQLAPTGRISSLKSNFG